VLSLLLNQCDRQRGEPSALARPDHPIWPRLALLRSTNVAYNNKYTCTVCGRKSQRRKGDVNDLEVHHIDPNGGYGEDKLRTACLPCHYRLTAIQQAD